MINFQSLATKYGTPLYVYDFNHIQEQYAELKNNFKARKSLICYAIKANSNLSVIKHLVELGAGCDCVSIGEVRRAIVAGAPKYKIIFSGVGKRDEEIKEAIEADILMINLESEGEFNRIELIAKELGKIARISIRVNPNIDPKTHPYISTGLGENKFGVDISTAKRLYLRAKNSPHIDPVGIHFHIGSQLCDLEPIYESAKIVSELLRNLKALKINIKFFDIGGGVGITYKDEETINPYNYAQVIFSTLSGLDVTLVCEPGRYLVGNSGYFLTKVLYEKQNDHKRFIVVDGAMNDLLRPSLYKAYHEIEILGKNEDTNEGKDTNKDKDKKNNQTLADVVGPVCESGDFFAKDRLLPTTEHGDLMVIKSAGAYGFSMSSNYNTRGRAAEVAILDEKDKLIRKRESFEDLIANEKGCL